MTIVAGFRQTGQSRVPAPRLIPEPRNRTGRLRAEVVARLDYLAAAVVAAAVSQTWFRLGRHTASGDVLPFLRDSLASSLADVWGYQLTGAGSPSYEVARVIDVILIRSAALIGLGPTAAQRIYYTGLACLAALGGTYLAAAFSRRRVLRAAAGVWVVANPYWLVLVPNAIFLLALALGTLAAGVLIRAARCAAPRVGAVVLGSTLLSALAVNPALMAVLGCWVLLVAAAGRLVAGPGGVTRSYLFLARAAPLVAAANLFWLVPAVITVSGGSTAIVAEVSPEVWSWSHAQNSIANVIALNAHWGWAFPDTYYPFAPRLEGPWFAWLRFAIPALAVLAPLVCRGRQRLVAATALALIAVVALVGKGLHPPLAGINRWLYQHVPGMWLLREPMSKVGWVMVAAYLVGAVLAADRILELASRRPGLRAPSSALMVAVGLAALGYVHPLWTGEAVPDQRGGLPGAYVQLPQDWKRVAEAVEGLDDGGSVLLLPLPTFYQMGHTWGYYGADQVPSQLIARRTIHPAPGGYFGGPPTFEAATRLVEASFLSGNAARADRLLEALGVSTVVVRRDYDSETSLGDPADPALLTAALGRLQRARLVASTQVADVWQLDGPRPRLSVTADLVEAQVAPSPEGLARAIAATTAGAAVLESGALARTTPPSRIWAIDGEDGEVLLEESADVVLAIDATTPPSWRLNSRPWGLEVAAAQQLVVDGIPVVWADPIYYPTGRTPEAAWVEGRLIQLDGSALVAAPGGAVIDVYVLAAQFVLTSPADDQVGDCNAYDDRPPEELGLSLERSDQGVRLSAGAHAACVRFLLPAAAAGGEIITVTVEAEQVAGSPPRMCIWDPAALVCVASEVLDSPTGALSATIPAGAGLEVFLYADEPVPGAADLVTVASYSFPQVGVLRRASSISLPDVPRSVDLPGLSAGKHRIETRTLVGATGVGPTELSPLEDCHRSDGRTPEEAGLQVSRPDANTVQLEASAHTACVWALLGSPQFGALDVSLEYRVVSGAQARVCLWQAGPDRCAELPPLDGERATWQRFGAVAQTDLSARELRLYLYADAPVDQVELTTVVQYRNLVVSPAAPWTLVAATDGQASRPIPTTFVSSSPDMAMVVLPDTMPSRPALVVLGDAFDPHWTLEGAPGGKHVLVDGWANGWLFKDGTALAGKEITAEYLPGRWGTRSAVVSGATLAAMLCSLVVAGIRSKHGRTLRGHDAGTGRLG